jgi:hypothetical protein
MPHSKKSTEISEMENEKKGSAHALPTILDLNIITDELEEIEKSIKAIQ